MQQRDNRRGNNSQFSEFWLAGIKRSLSNRYDSVRKSVVEQGI